MNWMKSLAAQVESADAAAAGGIAVREGASVGPKPAAGTNGRGL